MNSELLKLFLVLLVGEFVEQMELARFIELANARVTHSIEECRFHHGVVNHVLKDNLVSDLKRLVEGEISELVAGETGVAC